MRVVFMGTPEFAVEVLRKLVDDQWDVVAVYTQPDKPKNRGMKLIPTPVKEYALTQDIPVFQPLSCRDEETLAELRALEPDVIVVAYGTNDWRFITPEDFDARYGALLDAIDRHYPTAQVFLITPIWRKDTDTESRWERFELVEEHIRAAAACLPGAVVIRGMDLVPHDERYYADLRLHPNDKGFACYFEQLWPQVEAALKE